MTDRLLGKLIVWRGERGQFGFLSSPGSSKSLFIHRADIDGLAPDAEPKVGDLLEYEVATTARGPRAVRARLLPRTVAPRTQP